MRYFVCDFTIRMKFLITYPKTSPLYFNQPLFLPMEKTARIFSLIKEKFSVIDLVLMAPAVSVIASGFIR